MNHQSRGSGGGGIGTELRVRVGGQRQGSMSVHLQVLLLWLLLQEK